MYFINKWILLLHIVKLEASCKLILLSICIHTAIYLIMFLIKSTNTAFMINGIRIINTSVSIQQFTSYLKGFSGYSVGINYVILCSACYVLYTGPIKKK